MKLDTWIGGNVYNMHSILFSLPVCSSVRLFSCLLKSGSCDNLKIIKVRCIKRGVSISSYYTNTDFNLKLIINGNKQERMIIKELFEGPVGDCKTIKCLFIVALPYFPTVFRVWDKQAAEEEEKVEKKTQPLPPRAQWTGFQHHGWVVMAEFYNNFM